jgi:hypothetical protein
MRYSTRFVWWIAVPALILCCGGAAAAVTCEQLGQMALSSERLRDQGYPLPQIMTEIDRLVAGNNFSAEEIAGIRRAVNDAFLRTRTANEVVVECMEKAKN